MLALSNSRIDSCIDELEDTIKWLKVEKDKRAELSKLSVNVSKVNPLLVRDYPYEFFHSDLINGEIGIVRTKNYYSTKDNAKHTSDFYGYSVGLSGYFPFKTYPSLKLGSLAKNNFNKFNLYSLEDAIYYYKKVWLECLEESIKIIPDLDFRKFENLGFY